MEWCFFEKFETAGTQKADVKERAVVEEIKVDTLWDEKNEAPKLHWDAEAQVYRVRKDTHTVHRHSHTAYSHYAQHKVTVADAPRWPARDEFDVAVHRGSIRSLPGNAKKVGEEGPIRSLASQKWWANSKMQPIRTPASGRQAHGVHVSTWRAAWQMPSSLDPHDSSGAVLRRRGLLKSPRRRFVIQSNSTADTAPVPGEPSRSFNVSGGLLAPEAEGKTGMEVLLASVSASSAVCRLHWDGGAA
jgi:hypothetical protein